MRRLRISRASPDAETDGDKSALGGSWKQGVEKLRVLLVDDERDVRALLRLCISDRCDEVEIIEEAGNGQEAVDKVSALRPDVVIMDLKMPVMDGIEATRKIKQLTPDADVVVYSVTAEHRDDIERAGASDQFLKGDIEGLFSYLCPEQV
jgi:CheY-like chemotaxis protein